MSKILEKSLKDARKENKLTMGSKQVLNSVNNSKVDCIISISKQRNV